MLSKSKQIASGSTILEESPASVQKLATKALQDLDVHIKFNTRAAASKPTSNTSTDDDKPHQQQQLTLTLSDNTTLLTHMYIPTFGLVPNSGYIPARFLNPGGFVLVDEFLNIRGSMDTDDAEPALVLKDVWALGDVADVEYAQFISCDKQSAHLAKNILLALRADAANDSGGSSRAALVPYKPTTKRMLDFPIS